METAQETEGIIITEDIIRAYIESLDGKNLTEATRKQYETKLWTFYRDLPEDKRLEKAALEKWRARQEVVYSSNTINSNISVINSFIEWLDGRGFRLLERSKKAKKPQPEMTRTEYCTVLKRAISCKDERGYLLVKIFATTGIAVQKLPKVTVEAVRDCFVSEWVNEGSRRIRIPDCLKVELLSYAERQGIFSGSIFRTRQQRAMERSSVHACIQKLCRDAHIGAKEGSPRCLQKLYMDTQKDMRANLSQILEQAYDRLLETEQATIGWPKE